MEADIPEPSPSTSAAAAHVHLHSPLLPRPPATPVVPSASRPHSHTQGAAAKCHPRPGPQRAASPVGSAPPPPCTRVGPGGQAPLSQPRQCSPPCSYWLVWLQWCGSYWKTHSPPCSGAPWGPRKGVGSPKTSLASTPTQAQLGPQQCFLVVQEPGPSVASSSFRKPNCSFIF